MALGDDLGNKLKKPANKKTQQRERRPIKVSRIKYIVISIILLLSAIFLMIFMLWAKGGADTALSADGTDNLYSAGRYFCRIKYPDNWEVVTGENGFYINKDTGLILQLYPYTTKEVQTELAEGATEPPTTPEPLKIQTEGVLVSVYYQPAPDFSWPTTAAPEEGTTPTPTPEATGAPTPTPAAFALAEASERSVELMKTKILPAISSEGGPDFSFSSPEAYEGKNCSFQAYTYQYTDKKGNVIKGEMYVCSRAMSYYMVNYEAREGLFDSYRNAYQSMVNNFILSVFDY